MSAVDLSTLNPDRLFMGDTKVETIEVCPSSSALSAPCYRVNGKFHYTQDGRVYPDTEQLDLVPITRVSPEPTDTDTIDKFWIVWSENGAVRAVEKNSSYTFKHESLSSAKDEAVRLAEDNPHLVFVVLEAKAQIKASVQVSVATVA